ncbi:hypothetical protein K438DRAFT_991291 [Mycena galopus ATCC 62051]|nr:hypothetical protein K438DRAFT_991291 [Mycena galopus ATCC 62051]
MFCSLNQCLIFLLEFQLVLPLAEQVHWRVLDLLQVLRVLTSLAMVDTHLSLPTRRTWNQPRGSSKKDIADLAPASTSSSTG